MGGTGDMFVASDIAFEGSRIAFSRFAASVRGIATRATHGYMDTFRIQGRGCIQNTHTSKKKYTYADT
eukprot:6433425-Prymnesium_polylepis.1